MCNNLIPQKIGIFIWRALLRRIPVRVELNKRGIDLASLRCPVCDDDIETVDHILLNCSFAKDIWDRLYRWWNMGNLMHTNLEDLFKGINKATSSSSSKLWQAVVWICGYLIWQNKNSTIFRNYKGNGPVLLNEIQIKAYEWISKRSNKFKLDWNQWLINPSSFDDHG
ncbi:uncharacterized protein [Rutidosis leptorrhynchoides]|uniref:uncharacterized protein n=1 Tax=Rutidosis leptorrhynchoides TaxID=125765 RepID=UPI003A99C3B0